MADSVTAKKLWDDWNIRCAVLISLFLQLLLTLLGKSRKRWGNTFLTALIWLCYLLADWIAAFAVGLISSRQTDENNVVSKQLAAFWAPFLLLHLGGPDSITAFSLEDNELWIRHLLGLLIQLAAVVYVFVQSLPNEYWIPMVVMFLAGTCKYVERTVSLYRACLGNFKESLLSKPDPGPNYAQLMQEYAALEASEVPVKIDIVKEPEKGSPGIQSHEAKEMEYVDMMHKGYEFFETFKGLIVDRMFSFHERNESRKFFFIRTAEDAFTVMEVELNFMYDALYTKMKLVHSKIGCFFRLFCTTLIVVCFQQFISLHQHKIVHVDKVVTYVLLVGALCLDVVNLLSLVFSDWMIISAKPWLSALVIKLQWKRSRRWSNTIFQHSFISFCCLKERPRWLDMIADLLKIKSTLDELKYKGKTGFEKELKEFIFNEIRSKAEEAESRKMAKEIYSARGEWALSKYPCHYPYPSISSSLSVDEAEYDESLLLWHIATELCYFESCGDGECDEQKREFCKILSDYMLYLLVMRPTLMSTVAGIAQIRYQDTCAEAKKFLQHKKWEAKEACKKLLDVKTVVRPSEVKGDRSKSLLFDACILANDLKKLNDRRWEIMSKIWVELLSFAASHCRPDVHARQLSQGGELITFVWLLMLHFGLGEQFRIEAGHSRAKLIIRK